MKLSAIFFILCAAAIPAGAEQYQNWPPSVTPETLGAVAAPAPSLPTRALPQNETNYSAAEEILIKEFNIIGINIDIPEAEVGAQLHSSPGSVCFEQALRSALKSFLTDNAEPTSPLAGVLSSMGVRNPSKSDVKVASRKMMQLLNMPGSSLTLVRAGAPGQAERGEQVKKNWIFRLTLDYAARSYWAVVDRGGEKPVYNYGSK